MSELSFKSEKGRNITHLLGGPWEVEKSEAIYKLYLPSCSHKNHSLHIVYISTVFGKVAAFLLCCMFQPLTVG